MDGKTPTIDSNDPSTYRYVNRQSKLHVVKGIDGQWAQYLCGKYGFTEWVEILPNLDKECCKSCHKYLLLRTKHNELK